MKRLGLSGRRVPTYRRTGRGMGRPQRADISCNSGKLAMTTWRWRRVRRSNERRRGRCIDRAGADRRKRIIDKKQSHGLPIR